MTRLCPTCGELHLPTQQCAPPPPSSCGMADAWQHEVTALGRSLEDLCVEVLLDNTQEVSP